MRKSILFVIFVSIFFGTSISFAVEGGARSKETTSVASTVSTSTSSGSVKWSNGLRDYPDIVAGLKQFPEYARNEKESARAARGEYIGEREEELVTIVGIDNMEESLRADFKPKFNFLCADGRLFDAEVYFEGYFVSPQIYLHEIMPSFGKYKMWHPVLMVPKGWKDGERLPWYWIELTGGFRVVYGSFDNGHKKPLRYENEDYSPEAE